MKPPKEPKTWNRPRLYFQEGDEERGAGLLYSARIRIIYPDGRAEWMGTHSWGFGAYEPCWARERIHTSESEFVGQRAVGGHGKCRSPQEALRKMRKYDKFMKFKPADFCGEL